MQASAEAETDGDPEKLTPGKPEDSDEAGTFKTVSILQFLQIFNSMYFFRNRIYAVGYRG